MNRLKALLLSLVIAAVLLAVLVLWGDVDAAELWATWRSLPLSSFLIALSVHAGIYTLRAVRFRVLIPPDQRPPLSVVSAVSAAHNLAAYVLPAKTGEASLILYLKRVAGVGGAEGLASLFVSRLLDLTLLAGVSGAACVVLAGRAEAPGWLLPAGSGLVLLSVALLFATTRAAGVLRWTAALLGWLGLSRLRLGRVLLGKAEEGVEALRTAGREGRLVAALLLSVPLWGGVFLFYAVLALGFGLHGELDVLSATFGSSLAVAFNLLPVNGFAAFGTQEAGWVLGFTLLGASRELAFSTGVGVHLIQLLDVVLFGLLGHLAMGLVGARPRPAGE